MTEALWRHCYPSPVGDLLITGSGRTLTGLHFDGGSGSTAPRRTHGGTRSASPTQRGSPQELPDPLARVCRQLDEYFVGDRTAFDLPLELGGTPFQRKVWQALEAIPYGETVSYGEVARRIGSPRAVRGVGGANGRNPVAIVVPCHRVIAADGSLGGYGGGLERKRRLLELEGWKGAG